MEQEGSGGYRSVSRDAASIRKSVSVGKSESACADTGNIRRADPGDSAASGSGGYGEEKCGSIFPGNEAEAWNRDRAFKSPEASDPGCKLR